MEETEEFRSLEELRADPTLRCLARGLAVAYIAYQQGVRLATAEKYVKGDGIADRWLILAEITIRWHRPVSNQDAEQASDRIQ